MLHIHWLSPYKVDQIDQIWGANLASVRLRAGALLSTLSPTTQRLTIGDRIPEGTDVCIVGKIGANEVKRRAADWAIQITRFRARGGRLILDYTDDHLSIDSSMSIFYRETIHFFHGCICSSRLLARSIARNFCGRIQIIPDAVEIITIDPKAVASAPVAALWFGHATNLNYLIEFIPCLKRDYELRLLIMTNVEGIRMLQGQRLPIPSNLIVEGAEWGVAAMMTAAKHCDLCIIPSNPSDPRKAGASSNRLMTAMALGLPTAAERLDSYLDYGSMFVDIRSKQFDDLLANPVAFRDQVLRAQEGPVREHKMEKIGQRWIDAIIDFTS